MHKPARLSKRQTENCIKLPIYLEPGDNTPVAATLHNQRISKANTYVSLLDKATYIVS